jgi:hypothetical protein
VDVVLFQVGWFWWNQRGDRYIVEIPWHNKNSGDFVMNKDETTGVILC